jgi:hypothetical protein
VKDNIYETNLLLACFLVLFARSKKQMGKDLTVAGPEVRICPIWDHY